MLITTSKHRRNHENRISRPKTEKPAKNYLFLPGLGAGLVAAYGRPRFARSVRKWRC
jgi:hypothetical protein